MKPDPYLIRQGFWRRGEPPSHYAFVGDSETDSDVSRRTGIRSIGYAKTSQRGRELSRAGPDTLITSMQQLADAVLRTRSP